MKIVTEYNQDMIKQYLENDNDFNVLKQMQEKMLEEVIFLKAEGVRKALIKLGWTPPKEEG